MPIEKALQNGPLRCPHVRLNDLHRNPCQETEDQDGLQGWAKIQERGGDGQKVWKQEAERPAKVGIISLTYFKLHITFGSRQVLFITEVLPPYLLVLRISFNVEILDGRTLYF